MKKPVLLSLLMVFVMSSVSFATASKYEINDSAIEAVLESGVQLNAFDMVGTDLMSLAGGAQLSANPNPWVAFALCWVVGVLGIHRVYMGGKGSLIAIYFFTCGGLFGIVTFVDWVVLLIGAVNDDISKYVGNNKFIMWAN